MENLAVVRDREQAHQLVNPERRKLLEALVVADSASGLARRFQLPRQRLNYHLRELERAGLVAHIETRRKGNCLERVVQASARSYVLSPEVLGPLGQTPDTAADRFSASYLIALAARMLREVASLLTRANSEKKRLATLAIDTDLVFASPDDRAQFADELAEAVARLTAKYHQDRSPNGRRFRLIAASYPSLNEQQP